MNRYYVDGIYVCTDTQGEKVYCLTCDSNEEAISLCKLLNECGRGCLLKRG